LSFLPLAPRQKNIPWTELPQSKKCFIVSDTHVEAPVIIYEGNYISLRTVTEDDLETILNLRNNPSTWSMLTDPLPITVKDQKAWFSNISLHSGRFYAVACNGDHSFIGLVRIDEHDPQNRNIRVGLDVLPDHRGQGYGKKIYDTILAYCFRELNVHRVWLQVLDCNQIAIDLYLKVGFSHEGVQREAVYRAGAYRDYILMSILKSEF
jgi:RimJ/RimL family protein N-acetyltransferase